MEGIRRWEDMEADCLINIFQRLGVDDMTLAVPFVCRSWYKASFDPFCWRVLNFRALDFMPLSRFAKRFRAQYGKQSFSFTGFLRLVLSRCRGYATEISFPLIFGPSMDELLHASIECPGLKTVVLPVVKLADEKRIPEVLGRWKDLEWLEMESKPYSFLEIASQISGKCKKLVGFKMHGDISSEDALALVTLLPKLKYLNLSESYLRKEELLAVVGGCRELERLVVRDCLGFEADEEVLRGARGIKAFGHEGSKLLDGSSCEADDFGFVNNARQSVNFLPKLFWP